MRCAGHQPIAVCTASHKPAAVQDCDDWLKQMMRKNEMLGKHLPLQSLMPPSCASHLMLLRIMEVCSCFLFPKRQAAL